ncbi:MAG: glucose-1-phosphate adenylyltransferase [Gammaproteobacteria bacterium]
MAAPQGKRFVSRLTRTTLALVLAGGRGGRLKDLTCWRAKPAVPFGGKFRIIDFSLSNCVNSGIRRIGVLTQYKAHSLIRHLQQGWGFLHTELGEFVEILPASQRVHEAWYQGTADALYQNIDILRTYQPNYVLVLAGDHVYKMDYGPMLASHFEHKADLTIACMEVPLGEASAFGVMWVNERDRVVRFQEKPQNPDPIPGHGDFALASMGIYVFNTDFLYEQLIKDADTAESSHDFGKDLIPSVIDRYAVYVYPFRHADGETEAYWRDVGTLEAYYDANMELISVAPKLNLYDTHWPIWTYQEQLPPAKFVFNEERRRGMAVESTVSGGCIISGAHVCRSLLFSNVRVESYSRLEECVVFPDVQIGSHSRIRRAILDKACHIPSGTAIGEDRNEDTKRFHVTPQGIVLVTPDMLGQEIHHVR